jgi:3'-phosphoadenosine 5'-phosphosulfate sulfotransferase (PAPS reductase)/FAD synthetase
MKQYELEQKQSLNLNQKIILSEQRIRNWYNHWDGEVYIAFSGGKDSTVLLHIVRDIYPDVEGVYCDTGLEFPEIRDFVKTNIDVKWIKPSISFKKVLEKYGYPVISKEQAKFISEWRNAKETSKLKTVRWNGKNGHFKISEKWKKLALSDIPISHLCCNIMKKRPFRKYEKQTGNKPFIGNLAQDSSLRKAQYISTGCNNYDTKNPSSKPLSFWLEKDIWDCINQNCISYSKIYDMGYSRTGCMFCMFGIHLEPEPNRFQLMKYTHPKYWDYCINKLGCGKVMDFIGVNYGNMDLYDFH